MCKLESKGETETEMESGMGFEKRNDEPKDLLRQSEQQRQQNIIAASNEVRNKLANLRDDVIKKYPGLADIVKDLKIEDKGSSAGGGVAATDGKNIEVNAEKVLAMGDRASKIIAHELWHIKRNDAEKLAGDAEIATAQGNIKIGNIPADAVINDTLGVVEGGVNIRGAKDMNEQKLYDIIRSSLEDPEVKQGDFHAAIFGDDQKWQELCERYEEKKKQKEKGEEGQEQDDGQEQEADGPKAGVSNGVGGQESGGYGVPNYENARKHILPLQPPEPGMGG